jgi:dihydroorotase
VAHLLESFDALDKLEGFVSTFGRCFYRRELSAENTSNVILRKVDGHVIEGKYGADKESIAPFWAGKGINWKIVTN